MSADGETALPYPVPRYPLQSEAVPHIRPGNPERSVTRIYTDGRQRCRSERQARRAHQRGRGPRWVKASRLLHSVMDDDRRVARDADLAASRALRQKHQPNHGRETNDYNTLSRSEVAPYQSYDCRSTLER